MWLQAKDKAGGRRELIFLVGEGAERSLIRRSTANKVEWSGKVPTLLQVRVVGDTNELSCIGQISLRMMAGGNAARRATIMTNPVGPAKEIHFVTKKRQNLADLPLVKVGGQINILLDLDNLDLIHASQTRAGSIGVVRPGSHGRARRRRTGNGLGRSVPDNA